jgi:hypothetical protein
MADDVAGFLPATPASFFPLWSHPDRTAAMKKINPKAKMSTFRKRMLFMSFSPSEILFPVLVDPVAERS